MYATTPEWAAIFSVGQRDLEHGDRINVVTLPWMAEPCGGFEAIVHQADGHYGPFTNLLPINDRYDNLGFGVSTTHNAVLYDLYDEDQDYDDVAVAWRNDELPAIGQVVTFSNGNPGPWRVVMHRANLLWAINREGRWFTYSYPGSYCWFALSEAQVKGLDDPDSVLANPEWTDNTQWANLLTRVVAENAGNLNDNQATILRGVANGVLEGDLSVDQGQDQVGGYVATWKEQESWCDAANAWSAVLGIDLDNYAALIEPEPEPVVAEEPEPEPVPVERSCHTLTTQLRVHYCNTTPEALEQEAERIRLLIAEDAKRAGRTQDIYSVTVSSTEIARA